MATFNPIQDLDPGDTYTKIIEIQWKQLNLLSGHQALMIEQPGLLRKA